MNITDGELLRRYTRDRSEAAFEELVRRHVNLIYSAALRQVSGDAQLAEDVTQSVFTDLAGKAAQLTCHPSLTGWLYTSTRFIAANIRRTEQRRTAREQEAHAMNALLNSLAPEPDWAQIRPLLDDAMHTLDEQDREAVLLRHFEHRSFAEIGGQLGLAENAARMRVARALEKLQEALRKRGVTSTALALAGLLTANGVGAAPAHLAARIARTALVGAASAGGLSVLLAQLFTVTKMKLAAAALLITAVVALIAHTNSVHHNGPPPIAAAALPAPAAPAAADATIAPPPTNAPAVAKVAAAADTNGLVLHLQIVAADSGLPIPHVPVDYRGWSGQKFKGKKLTSTRLGLLDVVYPTNITILELTTREDDFADTKLLWRPPNGDVIPTNYVLKLDRPVAIGGRVVDADGNPVEGAMVGWNHEDDPTAAKLPQNHEFAWIEVSTDKDGRWRINRIGADMISRIYGSARDSNYVDSKMIFVSRDKTMEKELRAETHVFQLGTATAIKGIVVNDAGEGIANAKILVGYFSGSDRREGKSQSDGTFIVRGCPPGKQLVTANAKGYAVTTIEANLAPDAEPIRLVVHPGKVLRLRVVNNAGQPIPKAQIFYEVWGGRGTLMNGGSATPPQLEYSPKADKDGRAVWTNAPDVELAFDAEAPGYLRSDNTLIRPDGEEHTITLSKALSVHGAVVDESTGQPISHFRIAIGWPDFDPINNKTNAHWSNIGRFWIDFANGKYNQKLEEYPIGGMQNRGYFLKFVSPGYAPLVSRLIGPDEGDVQLDVSLQHAVETAVLVYTPDGHLAADADIGLVSPSSQLHLTPGGFDRSNLQSGGSLLQTGADGSFKLAADDSLLRIIAASADGYAEALPAALVANPVMQMQRWGRLEANCSAGGQPEAGRQYLIELDGGSHTTVSYDFNSGHLTSDAAGRISVPMLPPGQHNLIRLHPMAGPGNGMSWGHGNRTPFQIRPGETTTLNLDTNYVVTARLQWPAGVTRLPQWRARVSLCPVTSSPSPDSPGAAFAAQVMHSFPAMLNRDDTVWAQDVPPGSYTLAVSFFTVSGSNAPPVFVPNNPGTKIFVAGSVNISIPSDPSSGTINAGDIPLQPAPDTAQ